jgi:hypothetical protein
MRRLPRRLVVPESMGRQTMPGRRRFNAQLLRQRISNGVRLQPGRRGRVVRAVPSWILLPRNRRGYGQ